MRPREKQPGGEVHVGGEVEDIEPKKFRRLTVGDLDLEGKRVLVRVGFDVKIKGGEVVNDARIRDALPTIEFILDHGGKPILIAHMGRPLEKAEERIEGAGEISDEEKARIIQEEKDKARFDPVARRLEELLKEDGYAVSVLKADDITGESAREKVEKLERGEGGVVLLENTRHDTRETSKDPGERGELASEIATFGSAYVDEAFSVTHRKNASVTELAELFRERGLAASGISLDGELTKLEELLESPERPFVVVMGGAKVPDKIEPIRRLMKSAKTILIGGGMAYTFLRVRAQRENSTFETGKSLFYPEMVDTVNEILQAAEEGGVEIILPIDHIVGKDPKSPADPTPVEGEIPVDRMGLDIGPKTRELFIEKLRDARTIFWNGPMGAFDEHEDYAQGSYTIGDFLATSDAEVVLGGGETDTAFGERKIKRGLRSTGGGASIALIAGEELPGVTSLSLVEVMVKETGKELAENS